jgi:hypothetical protein
MAALEIFVVEMVKLDGVRGDVLVARGPDGSLWVDASYLELNRADLRLILHDCPGSVQVEPKTRRVFVKGSAFLAQCPDASLQRELTLLWEDLVDLLHPTNFR